ncbi:MAG TPA: GAF domain-containing sensor histidine kinase [Candidatus Limnocylindria bacterium]|nr:GAF domain-containing sensor histidine kinase [Candidatus Limnocylindria bacterium]
MNPSEAEQLTALLALQRELALEHDVDVVLRRIADTATHLLDAERATLYVVDDAKNEVWSRVLTEAEVTEIRLPLDGRSLAAEVARGAGPLRIDRAYEDPRFDPGVDARTGYRTRSILVLPIDSRDQRRIGVLQIVNDRSGQFDAADERIGMSLAASAGIALEYVALQRELAAERLRVVKIAEETRHRLARDLHDGVAQALANAAVGIEIAQRRARTDVEGAMQELAGMRERLLASQRELRDILFALRPVVLEEGGLAAAVRALAERVDGTNGCRVAARRVETRRRLLPEVEAGAFTVIREAVNNAVKTGRAPHVSVDVVDEDAGVSALVEDDGKGFDVATTLARYSGSGSLGLLQMRESARLIGARLVIDSSPGQGTKVRLRIPAAGDGRA